MKTPAAVLIACLISATAANTQDFPAQHQDTLQIMFEQGNPANVIHFINQFDAEQRLKLYHFARQVFVFEPWSPKDLDDLVIIADAGIEEAMSQAREAPRNPEIIKGFVDQANVMSFNLSADLAACWPGDTLTRYRRHYERGLSAALQCVEWRIELEEDPYPMYIAYWAAGMHQLSLGRYEQALYTLNQALNQAQQYTIDQGLPLGLAPQVGYDLILSHGYLGIALIMCGETPEQYDLAIQAFEEGIDEYPDRAEDYRFGVDQLHKVRAEIIGE